MENRWIKAVSMLPPTLKVCGKHLLPFCLRHRVALEAINSPLLNQKSKITPRDLLFAVRILSTYDMRDTRKPMTLRESYLLAVYTLYPKKFISEILKLTVYFNAQSLWPRFWEKENTSSNNQIPWHLSIIANLVRNGCTLREAWEMPESEAVWLHIANSKANGAEVDVVSELEWEAMEEYKKQQANETKTTNRN